jgi:DNA modification methylase
MHPTVKPVEMIKDAILDVTNRGDIVLDSFLGSGSTLIAAEQSGRTCYGIELEPLYIDTTIRRWQEFTGNLQFISNQAKHIVKCWRFNWIQYKRSISKSPLNTYFFNNQQ